MRAEFSLALATLLIACRGTHPANDAAARHAIVGDATPQTRGPSPPAPGDPVALARVSPDARAFCGIEAHGRVRCWGDAPIGSGSMTESRMVDGLDDIVDVAIGDGSACARRRDGRVACWGESANGEVGDGTRVAHTLPVAVQGLDAVDAIAPGGRYFCATLASGLRCWGGNAFGNLGTGDMVARTEPVAVPNVGNVASLGAGGGRTCAAGRDGTLQCWGFNPYSTQFFPAALSGNVTHAVPMSSVADVTSVALGSDFGCALRRAGGVACWGTNSNGQLGDGTTASRSTPMDVAGVDRVVQLAAGGTFACARRSDGVVMCWGGDRRGPSPVGGLAPVIDVALGAEVACVLEVDRRIVCWRFVGGEAAQAVHW